jgi:hypothetical protein
MPAAQDIRALAADLALMQTCHEGATSAESHTAPHTEKFK